MSKVLTETAGNANFAAGLVYPVNGEAGTIWWGLIEACIQQLADRTQDLDERTASSEARDSIAQYRVSGADIDTGAPFLLTEVFDALGNFTLSSNAVQVPAAGVYKITVSGMFNRTSGTDSVLVALKQNTTTIAGGQLAFADTTDSGNLVITAFATITTPASELISVQSSADDQTAGGQNPATTHSPTLTIERIS